MSNVAVRVEQLEKIFSSGFKLGPIDFKIEFGQVVAVLGASNSGKSALLNLITGTNEASSGAVIINDRSMHYDAFDLKRLVGYLPQYIELPKRLTLLDVFEAHTQFHHLKNQTKQIQSVVDQWDLGSFLDKQIMNCPYAIRKRIALALSILHDPVLLVLDEPFSEFDLFQVKAIESMIEKRSQQAKVTVIATHLIYYAAINCDRAWWLNNGLAREISHWRDNDFKGCLSSFENLF